jgi:hypothetical protein
MAKADRKTKRHNFEKEKKRADEKEGLFHLPLVKTNYQIIGLGVVLIIIGYIMMGLPDDPEAFLTKTLAPLILVVAYAVVIPFGIFYRKK